MNAIVSPALDRDYSKRDALAEHVLAATRGALEMFSMYIGDQLGFYTALAMNRACTPAELAKATGPHQRYVREWLEQQCVAGIVSVVDASATPGERIYYLCASHEVLTDEESLRHLRSQRDWLRVARVRIQHSALPSRRNGGLARAGNRHRHAHEHL